MYERFTDTARNAMQLANKAAQRYRHEYIGTEHILLGVVEEGSGLAMTILKKFDVDPQTIGSEVEKIVLSGPDMVTMGNLPQTPRAKKVITYAMEEARNLNHNYIGTEHLLLGLIREHEGVAGQVLYNLGVELDDVRKEVVKLAEREPGTPDPRQSGTSETGVPRFGARALGRFVRRAARAVGFGRWFGRCLSF
jgi:ATP-dependent Clp protease ATP-binding subunit ClpC